MKIHFTKIFIILLFITFTQISFAAKLPQVPTNCFESETYCHHTRVIYDSNNRKVIRLNLFASFDFDEFDSYQEILDLYFDFEEWGTYTEESEDIRFIETRTLDSIFIDGKEIRRHKAHYFTKAPWPIREMESDELTLCEQIDPYEKSIISWHFYLDKSYPNMGMKYKSGYLHIRFDQDQDKYRTRNLSKYLLMIGSQNNANGVMKKIKH